MARFYDFVPYHYGPFSFTLYHELGKLEAAGIIKTDRTGVFLNPPGSQVGQALPSSLRDCLDNLCAKHEALSTPELVDLVYERSPWHTVLCANKHRRAARRPIGRPAVYMLGYEGLSVEGVLDLLMQAGVTRLLDVRKNPVARRYGFHKSTLSKLCRRTGISYLHFPAVGIPSSWRRHLDTPQSYRRLLSRYDNEILCGANEQVTHLQNLMQDRPSALLCRETSPAHCHRSRLAAALAGRTGLPAGDLRVRDEYQVQ